MKSIFNTKENLNQYDFNINISKRIGIPQNLLQV